MTFAEAAIEVLFRAGRPLHYKKITEAAIQEELLSHVGRSPEVTMGERLTQEAKKQDTPPVETIRPGVYKLREDYEKELEASGKKRLPLGKKKPKTNGKTATAAKSSSSSSSKSSSSSRNKTRQAKKTNGRDTQSQDSSSDDSDSSRRRRRRSKTSSSTTNKKSKGGGRNGRRSSKKKSTGRRRKSNRRSSTKNKKSTRSSKKKSRRSSGRKDNRNSNRRNKKSTQKKRSTRKPANRTKHLTEGPVQMDAIARAAQTVLNDNKRRPMKFADLAEEIFDRKLVKFHTHDAAATVQAAMAGDNQIREQQGNRPLFIRYDKSRWGLTIWGLSADSVDREQSILSLAEEIRQDAVETLGEALTDIKAEAVEHLALTLLQRLGYQDIKVSKRSSEGDVFFTSDWQQGLADVRVCIQVVSDTDIELGADTVTELRGTLHHYSASEGVIIHLGDIDDDAISESREEKLAPITLLDRDTFVELLIKHGIGVRSYQAPITMVDTSFIDALASA